MQLQRGKKLNLLGQRFGFLTVLREGKGTGKATTWVCQCKCGAECEKLGIYLRRRDRKRPNFFPSCSQQCPIKCKNHAKKISTHGKSGHPVYVTWNSMKLRCYNPRCSSWERYGGRGITICKRWESFQNFWDDMSSTYRPGLEIDRKNSNRNYTPSNCRWVTRSQNMRNRKNSLTKTLGFPENFQDIALRLGIKRKCLYDRVYAGMTWDQIISTPVRGKNKQ